MGRPDPGAPEPVAEENTDREELPPEVARPSQRVQPPAQAARPGAAPATGGAAAAVPGGVTRPSHTPTPVPRAGAMPWSRKPTLMSPIPALLATTMGAVADAAGGGGDAVPKPVDRHTDITNRSEAATRKALLDEEEDDYQVEVTSHGTK